MRALLLSSACGMINRIALYCFALLVACCFEQARAASPGQAQNRAERLVLSHGVTVVLQPITSATRLAVVALYGAGSIHEPSGMPQACSVLHDLLAAQGTND